MFETQCAEIKSNLPHQLSELKPLTVPFRKTGSADVSFHASWFGVIFVCENRDVAFSWAEANESKCPFGVFQIDALGFG